MQDAFHAALARRINDELGTNIAFLANGMAADHESYRYSVGYIAALRDVLTICTEVQKKLYSNNPLNGEN